MDFLVGLLFILIGIVIIKYRYQIFEFSGEWGWATKYLGGNGTVIAIVLTGMLLVGIGASYPFGGFRDTGFRPNFQIEIPKK